MSVRNNLVITHKQSMLMSQRLQQSLQILHMSSAELSSYLDREAETNPALIVERPSLAGSYNYDGGDKQQALENIASDTSIYQHISEQIEIEFSLLAKREIAYSVLGTIDSRGFIDSAEVISQQYDYDINLVQAVIAKMQFFEPVGIFVSSVADSLTNQLIYHEKYSRTHQKILDNLEKLASRDFAYLKRVCKINDAELAAVFADIRSLNPHPMADFAVDGADIIQPDVNIIKNNQGELIAELSSSAVPRLYADRDFSQKINDSAERKDFNKNIKQADWLVSAVEKRTKTLLRVAVAIISQQQDFLLHGELHLKPMTMQDIANEISMSESTISRVVADKYISFEDNMFAFKDFFSSNLGGGLSVDATKRIIKDMIAKEDKFKPLSDKDIYQHLISRGASVTHRTIAKYRESIGIAPRYERRKTL